MPESGVPAPSAASKAVMASTLRKMMHHFVSESTAPKLSPEAPATASMLKALELTNSVDLITPRFFAQLPGDTKKLLFSYLFEKICAVDEEENRAAEEKTQILAQMSRHVMDQLIIDGAIVAAEINSILPSATDAVTTTVKQTKRQKTVEQSSSLAEKSEELKKFHLKVDRITDYVRSSGKKIQRLELVVPPLQKIVEHCLLMEGESNEWASRWAFLCDLCLATINFILTKLRAKDHVALESLIPAKINVELVVQCIRSPHATRQSNRNALSIVNVAAEVAPKAVLPNVISIFTFVGEHLLRRDDGFSLQILEQTLDAVVPVLVAENVDVEAMEVDRESEGGVTSLRVNENVAHALRVFVDAAPHIPAHRKLSVFKHLVTRLENQNALWCLTVIALEAQVTSSSAFSSFSDDSYANSIRQRHQEDVVRSETQKLHESFHFWIDLCLEFGIEAVVSTLQLLLTFVVSFPEHLVSSTTRKLDASSSSTTGSFCPFLDQRRLTPRQTRQLLYYTLSYANQLLAACVAHPMFLENQDTIAAPIRSLVETIVNLLLVAGRRSEASSKDSAGVDLPATKFWKGILSKGAELLDKINAKLSEKIFLTVIAGLMGNTSMNVKRKSLDLLAGQLSQMVGKGDSAATVTTNEPIAWLELIPPLLLFLPADPGSGNIDAPSFPPQTVQAALLCVKLLARVFGRAHPKAFVDVVKRVSVILTMDLDPIVRSSVFLTLAELCCCLKAQTVPLLNRVVPLLLAVILEPPSPPQRFAHDLLLVSSLTAVSKLLETIPEFLSPHLFKILVGISTLAVHDEALSHAEGPYKAQLTQRLPKIKEMLTTKTPTRSFLPAASSAFTALHGKPSDRPAIVPLMDLIKRHLDALSKEDFNAFVNQFVQFFVDVAFDFRRKVSASMTEAEVALVENAVVDASVSMVMRMSEPTFRPFYYRLYDWAVEESTTTFERKCDRLVTFYVISVKIAENLKTLFGLFIGHAIKNVVEVLKRCHVAPKKAEEDMDDGAVAETAADTAPIFGSDEKNVLLLRFVVDTLTAVFKYDKKGDVTRDNFDALHVPLVEHLENKMLLGDRDDNDGSEVDETYEIFIDAHLAPCLAAMAAAINDFSTWKKMTYQICLKTKSDSKRSRIRAIGVLEAVALAVGQEFLGLLPETAPFLAELMEDEEEEVEKRVQDFIHVLEEQLGENLQKYFT